MTTIEKRDGGMWSVTIGHLVYFCEQDEVEMARMAVDDAMSAPLPGLSSVELAATKILQGCGVPLPYALAAVKVAMSLGRGANA